MCVCLGDAEPGRQAGFEGGRHTSNWRSEGRVESWGYKGKALEWVSPRGLNALWKLERPGHGLTAMQWLGWWKGHEQGG